MCGQHIFSRVVANNNLPGFYGIVNKMKINIDVFYVGMKLLIVSKRNNGLELRVRGFGLKIQRFQR